MVNLAYDETNIVFGNDYIIPKPVDPRLLITVAPAVAKAAMETGVARTNIVNWEGYKNELIKRLGLEDSLLKVIGNKAKRNPKKVVFAEADNLKILKAAQIVQDEGIAQPVLLGNLKKIKQIIEENALDLGDIPMIDPLSEDSKSKKKRMHSL